jgi:hypothetical protein
MNDQWRQIVGFLLVFVVVPVAGMVIVVSAYMMFRKRSGSPVDRDGWIPRYSKTFRFSIGSSPDQMPVTGDLETTQLAQPLDQHTRDRYRLHWERTKDQFDSHPIEALREAEQLLTELMKERGWSGITLTEKKGYAMDLLQALGGIDGVFGAAENARAAGRGMLAAREGHGANPEDLRHAMAIYDAAFEKLLEDTETPPP